MVMEVLQSKSQIASARHVLIKKGVSSIESSLCALLRRFGLVRGVVLGDQLKSWDVLGTLNFIEQHVQTNEPILDIGCYASEIIVALHKSDYTNLTGADLSPALKQMPYQNAIHYEHTNFMHTTFADSIFKAVTAISVIEHGFDGKSLLNEMSRILKLGGYFIASFDYWPEKIDTTGIKFFGMDWKIFSKDEISSFVSEAAGYGLYPVGEMTYTGCDKPIDCVGKQYTFGWLVLTKVE